MTNRSSLPTPTQVLPIQKQNSLDKKIEAVFGDRPDLLEGNSDMDKKPNDRISEKKNLTVTKIHNQIDDYIRQSLQPKIPGQEEKKENTNLNDLLGMADDILQIN